MKCHIEYVGKLRNGTPQYYCTTHKSFASDKKGMKLESCLCNTKDIFDKTLNLEEVKIENLEIIYENLLKKTIPKMIINNEAFHGVLKYKECLLSYKDLGGILLSKLNKIDLEEVHSVVTVNITILIMVNLLIRLIKHISVYIMDTCFGSKKKTLEMS